MCVRARGRVGGSPPRLSESEKELERLLRVELEAPGIYLSSSRVDASPQLALDSRPSTTGSDGVDGLPQPKMPRFAGVAAGASRRDVGWDGGLWSPGPTARGRESGAM